MQNRCLWLSVLLWKVAGSIPLVCMSKCPWANGRNLKLLLMCWLASCMAASAISVWQYVSCFRQMCLHSLWSSIKCLLDYKSSPDFLSAQGWGADNGEMFLFGWSYSLSPDWDQIYTQKANLLHLEGYNCWCSVETIEIRILVSKKKKKQCRCGYSYNMSDCSFACLSTSSYRRMHQIFGWLRFAVSLDAILLSQQT